MSEATMLHTQILSDCESVKLLYRFMLHTTDTKDGECHLITSTLRMTLCCSIMSVHRSSADTNLAC
jgi:hypothetical protein